MGVMAMSNETEIKLTPKQKSKIDHAIKSLNDVRNEIAKDNEGRNINWFLEDTANLCLMDDDPKDTSPSKSQDRVIEVFTLWHAGGGGW
jgi:hypothetical protein